MIELAEQAIREMEPVNFWPVLGAVAIVTARSFFSGVEYWRSSRLIEDLPASRTRSAAQGYVQIVGRIADEGELTISPVSSERVAWWSLAEQKMLSSSSGQRLPAGLVAAYLLLMLFFDRLPGGKHEESENSFIVKDDTGDCEVSPHGARVITANRRTVSGATAREISPSARVALGDTAQPHTRLRTTGWQEDACQYVYQWLKPGEKVYILGDFNSEHLDLDGALDTSVPVQYLRKQSQGILKQWRSNKSRLLARFDINKDGKLDSAEWTLVRRAAMTEARMRLGWKARHKTLHRLRKPSSGRSFLIVSLDDPALGTALRRRAAIWLFAFFALGTLAVWAFNIRFTA